jgi:hypothetical protein
VSDLRVAVLQLSDTTAAVESSGWLRFLLEVDWKVPYRNITSLQIAAGGARRRRRAARSERPAAPALAELGARGSGRARHIRPCGGRYIGWGGGTTVAAAAGLTTTLSHRPRSTCRARSSASRSDATSRSQPAWGPFAWAFLDSSAARLLHASDPAHVRGRFPAVSSPDFFVSGFADDPAELGPARRPWSTSPSDAARRAVLVRAELPRLHARHAALHLERHLPDGGPPVRRRAAGPALRRGPRRRRTARARQAARRSAASTVSRLDAPIRISVGHAAEAATRTALGRYGARFELRRSCAR